MTHQLLFTAALGAALLAPAPSSAQTSDGSVARALEVRASATKLQSDARRLDARAAGLERAAARKSDAAAEARAQADVMAERARRARGAERSRLEAKADDLRTTAAIDDVSAAATREDARATRAEAKRLRARARQQAQAGTPSTRGRSSSLALASSTPCRVTIDGAFYGYTPHARIPLSPGMHDVVCESLDGVTLRHRVATRAGTIRRLHFDTAAKRTAAVIDPFR